MLRVDTPIIRNRSLERILLCKCGSNKQYENCCDFERVRDVLPITVADKRMTLKSRNLLLFDAIHDVFPKAKKIEDYREQITGDKIVKLYTFFCSLFPTESSLDVMIPEPGVGLRGLYLGTQEPLSVLQNVVRYALYCDEMIIVNPLLHPGCMAPNYNPLLHPDEFLQHTLKAVVALVLLEDWIREDFIILMPDPNDFDYSLRTKSVLLAEHRLAGWKPTEEDIKELQIEAKEDMSRFILGMPDGNFD